MKTLHQGPYNMTFFSAQKLQVPNFLSNRRCYDNPQQWHQIVPSMAWSMDSSREHMHLKAKESESEPAPQDVGNLVDACRQQLWDEMSYDDVVRSIYCIFSSERVFNCPPLKGADLKVEEERDRQIAEAVRKTNGYRLAEYISLDKELYKFTIMAIKMNADMYMEEGSISSYARDEIFCGLQRIENDIMEGNYEWGSAEDAHSNIFAALINIVGEPAKILNATINRHARVLATLSMWCKGSIDEIVVETKQLQVALVLLAIRNEHLVLPCTFGEPTKLGDFILSSVEKLEMNISALVHCKDEMASIQLIACPLNGAKESSLSSNRSWGIHDVVMYFGAIIKIDVAAGLSILGQKLLSWIESQYLIPSDEVKKIVTILQNRIQILEMRYGGTRTSSLYRGLGVPNNYDIEEYNQHILATLKIVPEMIKLLTNFVRSVSFNHEKVESSPPCGCLKAVLLEDLLTVKGYPLETSESFVRFFMKQRQVRGRSAED